jgi:hypothetical protein
MSLSRSTSFLFTSFKSIISSSNDVLTYLEIFRLNSFFHISSIDHSTRVTVSSFRFCMCSTILSMFSGSKLFCRLPFSKWSTALINKTSSNFLHFFKTKIQTGIPVEKNRFAGSPITVSMFPSSKSFLLIFSSATASE